MLRVGRRLGILGLLRFLRFLGLLRLLRLLVPGGLTLGEALAILHICPIHQMVQVVNQSLDHSPIHGGGAGEIGGADHKDDAVVGGVGLGTYLGGRGQVAATILLHVLHKEAAESCVGGLQFRHDRREP